MSSGDGAIQGVDYSTAAGLIGRRVAALYAGIAVMFFMARNAETSIARTALISGMITACMVLAFLGVYEFSTQNANPGILISVVIELAIAIAFMCVKCTRQTNYS